MHTLVDAFQIQIIERALGLICPLLPAGGPPSHIMWNIKWPFLVVMAVTLWQQLATAFAPNTTFQVTVLMMNQKVGVDLLLPVYVGGMLLMGLAGVAGVAGGCHALMYVVLPGFVGPRRCDRPGISIRNIRYVATTELAHESDI